MTDVNSVEKRNDQLPLIIRTGEVLLCAEFQENICLDPKTEKGYPITANAEFRLQDTEEFAYISPNTISEDGKYSLKLRSSSKNGEDSLKLRPSEFTCRGEALEVPTNTRIIDEKGNIITFPKKGLAVYCHRQEKVIPIMDGYNKQDFSWESVFENFLESRKRFECLIPDREKREIILNYAEKSYFGGDGILLCGLQIYLTKHSTYFVGCNLQMNYHIKQDLQTKKWHFEDPDMEKDFSILVKTIINNAQHYNALPEELRNEYDNMNDEQKMRFRNANNWNDDLMPQEPETVMKANETENAYEKNAVAVQEGSQRKMA